MISERSSAKQMLSDPDEGPLLLAILGFAQDQAADDSVWLRYAKMLEGRKDPRGEFLRLAHRLSARGPRDEFTSAQRARYRQLLQLLRPYTVWLKFVTRNDRILNCGQASKRSSTVRFQYACPNRWETMSPTREAGVHYCADCQRKVYFCDTAESVEQHVLAGDCVAVPQPVTNSVGRELTRNCTGLPEVYQLWGKRIFHGLDEDADSDR